MISMLSRFSDLLHSLLSRNLHNYGVLITLTVWAVSVGIVMWKPTDLRLAMAKDVGIVVLGWMGVVATAHTTKAIRGVEADGVLPRPPATPENLGG